MKICDYCFNDEEMQTTVRNESSEEGVCEASGIMSKLVDVTDSFSDFFGGVLNKFERCDNGIDIASILQDDWNLFRNADVARTILNYFLTQDNYGYGIDDKVYYTASIRSTISIWDDLKDKVKNNSRFFTSLESFDELGLMSRHNLELQQYSEFYRARVIPYDKEYLSTEEMGCPTPGSATPGRANPLGIPYLYLCQSEETTYYEVRALYLDRLSIGTFKTVKLLKLMDFTASMSLYLANAQDSDLALEMSKHLLLRRISRDLSRPLRRFDSELEYVPTQLICEYCKLNGIDGIKFNSSLHKGGTNVVLFDSSSAECVAVKTVEIKNVKISL